jgi:hypothetical protein
MLEMRSDRFPAAPRGRRWAVVLAVTTVLITSCAGGQSNSGDAGEPSVASVARPAGTGAAGTGAATPTAAVNVDDQRPLVRVDATEEERTRLFKTWEKCLVKEGGDEYIGQGKLIAAKGGLKPDTTDAAQVACAAQQPEDYEQREQRTDPSAFKEHNLQMYKCAKAKGYQLTAPEPDTGQFGLTAIGPQGDFGSPGMVACRNQAFGVK